MSSMNSKIVMKPVEAVVPGDQIAMMTAPPFLGGRVYGVEVTANRIARTPGGKLYREIEYRTPEGGSDSTAYFIGELVELAS